MPKKLKTICKYVNCKESITPTGIIIGKCKYCEYVYCSQHRLPEYHECINSQKCKEKAFQDNKAKNSQVVINTKITKI